MRVSFLNFFWNKPPANLHDSRLQLLAVENNPQNFSEQLNTSVEKLVYYNQYDEALRLIHYFKNRGLSNQTAIDAATRVVADNSEYDMRKDFAEYYILITLVLLLNSMTPAFAPPKDMPEEAHLLFVGLKSIFGALLGSAFVMYKRGNLLEKDSLEKRQATTSQVFKDDFIFKFTAKLVDLFENGVANVDAEQVRFEFQIKALEENSSGFHKVLVENPIVAAQCLENAFGEHLINVMPDANPPTKIHLMVKYRNAEQCRQLVNQINLPFFDLDNLNQAAKQNAVSYCRFGQGSPR